MAQEHQLIEPFTENQVRDADSGNKIISYGFQVLVTTCVVPMSLKFLLTLIQQPLIQIL